MAENAKEKRSGLKNVAASVSKSIRDTRGEMKKVVWPSRKQTINNTGIVLAFMAVMAVIIGVFDAGLSAIIRSVFNMGA